MVLFISSNFLDAQFQLLHFLSRKIIFYTGFFISVIALYLEKKDFVVIVWLLKRNETGALTTAFTFTSRPYLCEGYTWLPY